MKYRCDSCSWHGIQPLQAQHPFDPGDYVLGCPGCLGLEISVACDRENCWAEATCIRPPERLCHVHWREAEAGR